MSPLPKPDGWEPAFPGQRPPFTKGNEYRVGAGNKIAQTHGAFTPSIVEPEAEKYRDAILADPESSYLKAPRFSKRLWSYCLSEARVMRIEAWVSTMSDEEAARSDKGQTSPLELLRKWKTTASNEADKLGLTPVSWARIRKDFATANKFDVAIWLSTRRSSDMPPEAQAQLETWDQQAIDMGLVRPEDLGNGNG